MNLISRTIAIPIWYDKERIYVPSVDIPQDIWTVVWTLTPITPISFSIGGPEDAHNIEWMNFDSMKPSSKYDPPLLCANDGMLMDQQGWTARFENILASKDAPVAFQYQICLSGFPCIPIVKGKKRRYSQQEQTRMELAAKGWRIFDPVVIAQPDPIYP